MLCLIKITLTLRHVLNTEKLGNDDNDIDNNNDNDENHEDNNDNNNNNNDDHNFIDHSYSMNILTSETKKYTNRYMHQKTGTLRSLTDYLVNHSYTQRDRQ